MLWGLENAYLSSEYAEKDQHWVFRDFLLSSILGGKNLGLQISKLLNIFVFSSVCEKI